jgi:hypothetical protein
MVYNLCNFAFTGLCELQTISGLHRRPSSRGLRGGKIKYKNYCMPPVSRDGFCGGMGSAGKVRRFKAWFLYFNRGGLLSSFGLEILLEKETVGLQDNGMAPAIGNFFFAGSD